MSDTSTGSCSEWDPRVSGYSGEMIYPKGKPSPISNGSYSICWISNVLHPQVLPFTNVLLIMNLFTGYRYILWISKALQAVVQKELFGEHAQMVVEKSYLKISLLDTSPGEYPYYWARWSWPSIFSVSRTSCSSLPSGLM